MPMFYNASWRNSFVLVRDFGGNLLSIISDSLLTQTSSVCAMQSAGEEFKVPLPFTFRKKEITKFQGLPHFKWSDLDTQDVIGQGSFGAD